MTDDIARRCGVSYDTPFMEFTVHGFKETAKVRVREIAWFEVANYSDINEQLVLHTSGGPYRHLYPRANAKRVEVIEHVAEIIRVDRRHENLR
jgi:hypothetical protein